ncbi:MAG TPA: hypothetical protein VM840_05065 [Actinomycetota bacterium]|nr:hypothetical protein [Actinomycetota bacterium]
MKLPRRLLVLLALGLVAVPPAYARAQVDLRTSQSEVSREPARPRDATEAAVRAMSGLGMYIWRWEQTGSVDEVVRRSVEAGLSHLVVRASSTASGFYLAPVLSELLPKAHAAGLRVVAYDPPRFEDVEADVRRAHELISFRAAGHSIDAFAADIEPKWELLTPEATERYGARLREVAGPDFPLVAIVFPSNMVGARFPYAEVARHFDLISPMSYHRARTTDGPGFVTDSIRQLQQYGRPVNVSGQAFSYDTMSNLSLRGHPPRDEFEATIAAARAAGAVGMTFWVWEHAEPWVFEATAAADWPGAVRPGLGVRPPPARPFSDPGSAPPAATPAPVAAPPPADTVQPIAAARRPNPVGRPGSGDGSALRFFAIVVAATGLGVWLRRTEAEAWARGAAAVRGAAERGSAPILSAWICLRSSRPGSSRSGRDGPGSPPSGPA